MMTSPVAGIDPHQDSYTIGIVDPNGVELTHESRPGWWCRRTVRFSCWLSVAGCGWQGL